MTGWGRRTPGLIGLVVLQSASARLGLALSPMLITDAPLVLGVLRPTGDTLLLLWPLGGVVWLVVPPLRFAMHVLYFEAGSALGAAFGPPRRRASKALLNHVSRGRIPAMVLSCLYPSIAFDVTMAVGKTSRRVAFTAIGCGVTVNSAATIVMATLLREPILDLLEGVARHQVGLAAVLCVLVGAASLWRWLRTNR